MGGEIVTFVRMKRRPVIGITCNLRLERGRVLYTLDRDYVRAVVRAGGTPVLLPFFSSRAGAREMVRRVGGLLFTGGVDPHSRRWGERLHPKAELLHPERETSDFLTLGVALSMDKPLLAICCGCQELNVALGGPLHQHIYDLPGVGRHSRGARHGIVWTGSSRTRDLVGASPFTVRSWHHQSCRAPGRGLIVTAQSPDGLIEGIESTRHRFAVGVQWHPERMQNSRRQQALFRALISEARKGQP